MSAATLLTGMNPANETVRAALNSGEGDSSYAVVIARSITPVHLILFVLTWLIYRASYHGGMVQIDGAPTVGRQGWWEPDILLCWRYTVNAKRILTNGYRQFKDRPFVMKRQDVSYNILPHKYMDELRLVSPLKLSSIRANVQNLGHKWTFLTAMNTSNLHFRVVSQKLTPELPKYLDMVKKELDEVWYDEMPHGTDEWQLVDFQEKMRRFAARLAAVCFVGHPACRDEDWIRISVGFAMDTFLTGAIVRMFPPILHPVVAWLIPARYRVMENIRTAKRILAPLRLERNDDKDILFDWMMDHGTEQEKAEDEMAIRQLFITLAAVHTSSMTISHMMFDLCAHPGWFEVFREEVDAITSDLGPIGSCAESTPKAWLARLEKMDSFFVESQRMHVPTLFVPQRIATESMTLKDGTKIPKGCKITWAGDHHMNNPNTIAQPEVFDPLRSYRKRYATADQKHKFLATSVTPDSFAFGYGTLACPGRFFSVGEVKLILARLLSEYDFAFPDGSNERPKTIYVGENAFPDPAAKLLLKRRQENE